MGVRVVRTDADPRQEMHHPRTSEEIEIGERILVSHEVDDRRLRGEAEEGRPQPGRSVPDEPAQAEHGIDVGLGVVGPPLRDSVRGGERAEAMAETTVDLDAGMDHRRVQRRCSPHQIEHVGARVAVRVRQEHGMQTLIERLPQELLVEADRIESQERGGTPRCERLRDLAHHRIVRLPRRAVRLVERAAGDVQCPRRRDDVRQKARPRLQPVGFDEIGIGPDGGELQYLVEAFVQTRGFDVV